MPKFYITTPIYYINAKPHLGHSYTTVAADCLARYKRLRGFDTYFLTGTDEHGLKVAQAAAAAGKTNQEYADSTIESFTSLWQALDVCYDDFIRTTQDRHKQCVRNALLALNESGDIYKSSYSGWYCVPCETFWTESQLTAKYCPDCKRSIEKINEENYFFRLSKYRDWLYEYIKANPGFIRPTSRYNETIRFLETQDLTDLCISRPKARLSWGIPFALDEDMVTYVWFDALLNYVSALGYKGPDESKFKRFWPADIHLMAKDILRQHAVYWPIILKALGLEMPKMIFAHGWWMVEAKDLFKEGMKMSKSRGNVVDPYDVIENFGVDAYRYFLLREFPFGLDGKFSSAAIIKRYNSDLANDLGNLVYRTLTMIEKYFDGNLEVVDIGSVDLENSAKVKNSLLQIDQRVQKHINEVSFTQALDEIWALINDANKFVEDTKPWQLNRNEKSSELKGFLSILVVVIKTVAFHISPYMPKTAQEIQTQLNNGKVQKGAPLFPRIKF